MYYSPTDHIISWVSPLYLIFLLVLIVFTWVIFQYLVIGLTLNRGYEINATNTFRLSMVFVRRV